MAISGARNCIYPFKLCGKSNCNEGGSALKVLCDNRNHELSNTLVAMADLDENCWGSQNNTSKNYIFNYYH